MSQWESIRIRGLYNTVSQYYTHFPIEVRAVLAPWIEDNVFNSALDADNFDHLQYLYGFLNQMLDQLKSHLSTLTGTDDQSNWFRQTLTAKYEHIARTYQNDPATMFRRLKYCLEQEQQLIMSMEQGSRNPGQQLTSELPVNKFFELRNRLQCFLKPKSDELKHILQLMTRVVEDLGNSRETVFQIQEMIDSANVQQNGVELRAQLNTQMSSIQTLHQQKKQEFKQQMVQLLNGIKAVLDELKTIQELVLCELLVWKIEQRKSANGFNKPKNLDNIEELAKIIAAAVFECNQQLEDAQQLQSNEIIHTISQYPVEVHQSCQFLNKQINELIDELLTKMFVVERQPVQVIRSKTTPIKPGIKLRLLAGEVFNRNATSTVKVSLMNETEAKKQYEDPNYQPRSPIKLLNNTKPMRFETDTKTVSVEFTGIQLSEKLPARSKRNSKSKEGTESHQYVAEEKWYFVFSAEFEVLGRSISIRTTSCPVSITCHPNQDAAGWGTILWNNFAADEQQPFQVLSSKVVDCNELMKNLNQKFLSTTGRGFTDSNKAFIRHKLLTIPNRNPIALPEGCVSWNMFFIEPLEGIKQLKNNKLTTVSFWEWLFAIMKLCEKTEDPNKIKENRHFQQYWEDGKAVGFIFRNEMEHLLKQSNTPGTFMFRFSDTILGSVTLIWCDSDGQIQKYEPYTLQELKEKIPLADRVLYKSHLQYLYRGSELINPPPDNLDPWKMLKKDAFSKTPINASRLEMLQGYIIRETNEVEMNLDGLQAVSMTRYRNNSMTSSSTSSLCSSPNYSQQSSRCTPSSSSALAFSPSSVESPDPQNLGPQSQPHGSSGGQDIDIDFRPDEGFPDLNLYVQMEEAGFVVDQMQIGEDDD